MKEDNNASPQPNTLTHKQAVAMALGDVTARSAAQTPLQAQRRLLYAENSRGLLADLERAGFPGLDEVGDLRRRKVNYRAAVPILLKWLPDVTYLLLSEDIVRTLSVSFARKLASPEFLRLFRELPPQQDPLRPSTSEPPEEHLRWIIGNGLGIFAGPSLANDLIELALDRSFGHARYQIVSALPKTKDDRIAGVLKELLGDPTVRAAAVEALGKMKLTSARPEMIRLLADPDENVRKQAKKALKRIGG